MAYFIDTAIFLISTIFNLYLALMILRILLPLTHNSPHSPISQFVIRITNPIVLPIRKLLPWHNPIDIAGIVALCIVEIVFLYIYGLLQAHILLSFRAVLVWGLGQLLELLAYIWFFAILIQVMLSWVTTAHRNYIVIQTMLHHITAPILTPMQRLVPNISGIDITPAIALLGLYLIHNFIIQQIIAFGIRLAWG